MSIPDTAASGEAASAPAAFRTEKRRHPRQEFAHVQWIAPMSDGRVPPPAAFVEVRCRDISASGFSYLANNEPEHVALVVAFGQAPNLALMGAEIAHVSPVEIDGEKMLVVGCRYTGRPVY